LRGLEAQVLLLFGKDSCARLVCTSRLSSKMYTVSELAHSFKMNHKSGDVWKTLRCEKSYKDKATRRRTVESQTQAPPHTGVHACPARCTRGAGLCILEKRNTSPVVFAKHCTVRKITRTKQLGAGLANSQRTLSTSHARSIVWGSNKCIQNKKGILGTSQQRLYPVRVFLVYGTLCMREPRAILVISPALAPCADSPHTRPN